MKVYVITLGSEYDNDMGVYGVFTTIEEAFAHGQKLGEKHKDMSVLVTPHEVGVGRTDLGERLQEYRYSWEHNGFTWWQ